MASDVRLCQNKGVITFAIEGAMGNLQPLTKSKLELLPPPMARGEGRRQAFQAMRSAAHTKERPRPAPYALAV